jgi:hypothetical protein
MTDSNESSKDARDWLVAELHSTVETVSAAIDDAEERILEPLRTQSAELLDRVTVLNREVARLTELASETSDALRDYAAAPAAARTAEPPSLAPDSPLDQLEEHRRSITEAPIEFPARRRRFRDPAKRPVEIGDGVRMVVEQMRLAGEPDSVIVSRLEGMAVDEPDAVLAQVQLSKESRAS